MTRRAARLIAGGAAMLAAAVLADSAVEHYRGSFDNRAMPAPLVGSALALAADGAIVAGGIGVRAAPYAMSVHAASAAIGAAGLGFHTYNLAKQVGGIRWGTLFYQAPLGAPAALVLAGALGAAAQAVSGGHPWLVSGRVVAGLCAVGLAGNAAEVALLHFRGAYHNKVMYLPVTLTPLAALALAGAALTGRSNWIVTAALAVTAALGLAGTGFHAYGISREMGGWRNWRQNVLSGPPLPAPPSFTGLAIAGLGALLLMRTVRRG
jgi:hypothetical protein